MIESPCILIVDDEPDLSATMAERLKLRAFEVETADNGERALERVREREFSVVVLDLRMPGIDGLELLEAIKRERPKLPVILFTGQTALDEAQRGMQHGASDYIVKPIDIDKLIQRIWKAITEAEESQP